MSVVIIDLEGGVEVGTDDTANLVTPGFATPERLNRKTPDFQDDYFVLGSIMLSMIIPVGSMLNLHTGIPERFLREIANDYGLSDDIVGLILSLLSPRPSDRPRPEEVRRIITTRRVQGRRPSKQLRSSPQSLRRTIDRMAEYILKSSSTDRNDRLFPSDVEMTNPLNLAHGAVGVAYALTKLGHSLPQTVWDWILERFKLLNSSFVPGLYVGAAGIAWGLAEVGRMEEALYSLERSWNHPRLFATPDLHQGAAGVGLAHLYFWMRTGRQVFLDRAEAIGSWLLDTRNQSPRGDYWGDWPEGVPVGYALGASGISLFLLYLSYAVDNEKYRNVGRQALHFDLSYALTTDFLDDADTVGENLSNSHISFPADTDSNSIAYPYWFRGSAGVGTSLLRYAATFDDPILQQKLDLVIADTQRKYAIYPGLFNGLSGLGNFLMDCYEFTGNEAYRDAAERTARGVILFGVHHDDGIAIPGDDLIRFSTDLATGSAGVILFLHRVLSRGPNLNFVLDPLISNGRAMKGESNALFGTFRERG